MPKDKAKEKKKDKGAKDKSKSKSKDKEPSLQGDASSKSLPRASDVNSSDFEAGRAFERIDGTIPEDEFQRIWRAARSGALPPNRYSGPYRPSAAPPPHALPLPTDLDAGPRFDRFDTDRDGYITRYEFEVLLGEWQREAGGRGALGLSLGLSGGDASRLFSVYDSDGDGRLSRFEFLTLVRVEMQSGTKDDFFSYSPPSHLRHTSPLRSGETAVSPPVPHPYTFPSSSPSFPLPPHRRFDHNPTSGYTWFDETIGVPLATEGADAAKAAGHSVVSLKDAHRDRLAKLQEQLAVGLAPKREKLTHMLEHARSRIDEVRIAREAVERETAVEYEAVVERLRSKETLRVSNLRHATAQIQEEIDHYDRVCSHVDGTGMSAGAMVSLIQKFPDLTRAIDRLAQRPLPALPKEIHRTGNPPFGDGDEEKSLEPDPLLEFPREMKDLLEAVGRQPRYEEALEVKDRMLWEVLESHRKMEEELEKKKDLADEYSDELGRWLELTDRLSREVNHLRQVAERVNDLDDERLELLRLREADQEEIRILRAQNKEFLEDYARTRGGSEE